MEFRVRKQRDIERVRNHMREQEAADAKPPVTSDTEWETETPDVVDLSSTEPPVTTPKQHDTASTKIPVPTPEQLQLPPRSFETPYRPTSPAYNPELEKTVKEDSDNEPNNSSDDDPDNSYGNHNNPNNFACPTPHPGLGWHLAPPPAPTKRKPEENPSAEVKKVKKDEDHKRPHSTKARTLVRQMLEKLGNVDLSKLYDLSLIHI